MCFQWILFTLCIVSVFTYVFLYFRTINSIESLDEDIPLKLEIRIQEIRAVEYGYLCHFVISQNNPQSFLKNYQGYFYSKKSEVLSRFNQNYIITGKFKKEWYPRNPGEVDPRIYLLANQSLGEFEYSKIKQSSEPLSAQQRFTNFLKQKSADHRVWIQNRLDQQLRTCFRPTEYSLLKAMIIGDKTMINSDISNIYRKNGLSHILAISGLHIMLFIGCQEYVLRIFYLSKKQRFWLLLIVSIFYLWVLGFLISALRAMTMGLILIATIAYDQIYARERILFFVCCLFLIISPNLLFSISFLLSFGAVFSLFYLFPIFKAFYRKFRAHIIIYHICDSLNISLSILLVTFPILIYFFKGISLSGFIVNMFVLPVVPLFYIISMLSLGFSFFHQWLGRFLAGTSTILSSYMLAIMHFFDMDYSYINIGTLSTQKVLLYYLGLITFIIYQKAKEEKTDEDWDAKESAKCKSKGA